MELQDYVRVLRAHWIGVLLLTVLGVAAAAAYNYSQPEVYEADASGFVATGGDQNDLGDQTIGDALAKSKAKSYHAGIAQGRQVAEIVIGDLGLDTTPDALISRITVTQPEDTVNLVVRARAGTAEEAKRLADSWVRGIAEVVAQTQRSNFPKVVPVEAAALPAAPILPRTNLNLMLGLFAGFLLGLAYAVVRNMYDRRLSDPKQLERDFGVSVIGGVPQSKRLASDKDGAMPIALNSATDDAGRIAAESFRTLRTNLSYMDVDDPPRVIVVTSPRENDGKSTVAVNLAVAIAASGTSTVLIDGDLRRPSLAKALQLPGEAGLTDVLVGSVEADEVTQTLEDVDNLHLIAAGRVPPNPSELLGSQAMKHLLEDLAKQKIVIIDAPPLLPVTDAAILTRHADGALVVLRDKKSLDHELDASLANLSKVGGRALGVVMNRVQNHGGSSGYYYSSYYGSRAD